MSTSQNKVHSPRTEISKKKIVRQDRLDLSDQKATLLINNSRLKIENISYFGIAASSEASVSVPTTTPDATIALGDYEIGNLNLRLVRETTLDESTKSLAFEVVGGTAPIETIRGILAAVSVSSSHATFFRNMELIPAKFRSLAYDIKEWLCASERICVKVKGLPPILVVQLPNSRIQRSPASRAKVWQFHWGIKN